MHHLASKILGDNEIRISYACGPFLGLGGGILLQLSWRQIVKHVHEIEFDTYESIT